MPKSVMIDELHLSFRVPADLPETEADAVRTALDDPAVLAWLRRVVRAAVRAVPDLAAVRVTLAR